MRDSLYFSPDSREIRGSYQTASIHHPVPSVCKSARTRADFERFSDRSEKSCMDPENRPRQPESVESSKPYPGSIWLRSMDHRRKFACSWKPANRPDEGRRVRRTPWLRPRIMSATRPGVIAMFSTQARSDSFRYGHQVEELLAKISTDPNSQAIFRVLALGRRTRCSPRSTAGSPRASTPPT
jgi:hypothetical protein